MLGEGSQSDCQCRNFIPLTNKAMSAKKAFVLRIDQELFDSVEKWASDEFRSTNGQLEWIISQALKASGRFAPQKIPDDTENTE